MAIKGFRKAVTDLFIPLTTTLVQQAQQRAVAAAGEVGGGGVLIPDTAGSLPPSIQEEMGVEERLLFNELAHVYCNPEASREYGDIYQYCKSLEL